MVKKQKSVLSGAIKDLEAEVSSLVKEMDFLKKSIEKTSSNISQNRQNELALQKVLANLAEKEAKLQEHKKELLSKSDKVSDKLSRISKIKSEMEDL